PRRLRLGDERRDDDDAYSASEEGSAGTHSDCGIVRPSAFAALRLTTSSNFVGCSMGRSPGFAPLIILSTYTAAWRNISGEFTPYDMRPPAGTYSLFPNIVGSRLLAPPRASSPERLARPEPAPDTRNVTLVGDALPSEVRRRGD